MPSARVPSFQEKVQSILDYAEASNNMKITFNLFYVNRIS